MVTTRPLLVSQDHRRSQDHLLYVDDFAIAATHQDLINDLCRGDINPMQTIIQRDREELEVDGYLFLATDIVQQNPELRQRITDY